MYSFFLVLVCAFFGVSFSVQLCPLTADFFIFFSYLILVYSSGKESKKLKYNIHDFGQLVVKR